MVPSPLSLALVATTILSAITSVSGQHIPKGTYNVKLSEFKAQGCYSDHRPLQNHGGYEFQTSGNCQNICVGLKKSVMALTNGKDCWCGDLVPALQFKRPNSECDTPCAGFDKDTCGGYRRWQVFTTGYSLNEPKHYQVKNVEAGKSTVISSSNSAGQTVYTTVAVSSSTSDSSQSDSSGGTSTVGIAAGVVAGVVGLSAIIGGTFLWLRHKKRAEAEKERQENAVASFMEAGRKPQTSQSSLSDSRLDPDILSRRQSDGSIADNQDFSRRILQITNPDGY